MKTTKFLLLLSTVSLLLTGCSANNTGTWIFGLLGALTGGITAAAGGITAAIFFGVLVASIFKSRPKR